MSTRNATRSPIQQRFRTISSVVVEA